MLCSLGLAACSYDVTLGSVKTHGLVATSCGTWNSKGVHTIGDYFVGHSTARPDETLDYFVFDMSPVQGQTLTGAELSIPGTSDWAMTVPAPSQEGPPPLQFKLSTTPLPARLTLAQVTGGNDDTSVYDAVHAEDDLGFEWVQSGSTTNLYGAFTYTTSRLQSAADAAGLYPLFGVERWGEAATTDEYLYGGSVCNTSIVLYVTGQ
jgi:hypothetical protein